jgi:tripartite-type tricarboxylate transporter receptor subunit TctC
VLAPAGAPTEAIAKVNAAVNAWLASDKGRQDLAKLEMQAGGGMVDELRAFMASEVAKWGPIIKGANITQD